MILFGAALLVQKEHDAGRVSNDYGLNRSFSITFKMISHKKGLLYRSYHMQPQTFSMILSPNLPPSPPPQKNNNKMINCVKIFLQQSKMRV